MTLLDQLRDLNDFPIQEGKSDAFRSYGRILSGYDFSEAAAWMEEYTEIPEEGNIYVPSVYEMEKMPVKDQLQCCLYGGMPVQIGYCNGKNSTCNGFEYHKGSEINVALCDLCLMLGHVYDIHDNHYNVEDAQVFFFEKGDVFEMYQTTLHLSPLKVSDEGFRAIVVLPKDTNTPLDQRMATDDAESRLLLQKNKWVIAHPDRIQLTSQGAFAGVIGENRKLLYR